MAKKSASFGDQYDDEFDRFGKLSAQTKNACLIAQFTALKDSKVRKLFLERLQSGNLYRGSHCLSGIGISKQKKVFFDFDCPPEKICFVRPSFLVVVDFIRRKVLEIDPVITGPDLAVGYDQAPVLVTGTLSRNYGIGGETTGWKISMNKRLDLGNATSVNEIEVAPGKHDLSSFENKEVAITGAIGWEWGVERGYYPVVKVATIKEISTQRGTRPVRAGTRTNTLRSSRTGAMKASRPASPPSTRRAPRPRSYSRS
jgi:hypothetical protein